LTKEALSVFAKESSTVKRTIGAQFDFQRRRKFPLDLRRESPYDPQDGLDKVPSLGTEVDRPLSSHGVDELKLDAEVLITFIDNVPRVGVEEVLGLQ
jgi:hypothetical protein